MITPLFASDEGNFILFVVIVLGFIGAAFLRVAERWFNLPHTLHRWAIGWAIAAGVLVFAFRTWAWPPEREDDLAGHFAVGFWYGLGTGFGLLFLIPLGLFSYHYLFRPVGRWMESPAPPARHSPPPAKTPPAPSQEVDTTAQRRRDKARAGCELFYLSNPDLESAMPREKFEQFVSRFMGDNQPPEVVEENAVKLLEIMQRFVEKGSGTLQGVSIADRAKNLEEEIRQIQASNLSDREKETLVSMLKRQFMAGLQKEIEP